MDTNNWEREQLEKWGFFVHLVFDPPGCPRDFWNIHTHGVFESFEHLDFQIVINIGKQNVAGIFHSLVNNIKDGAKYQPGIDYDEIAEGCLTRFILAKEGDRDVLRLIVPDSDGNLDKAKMNERLFAYQYDFIIT